MPKCACGCGQEAKRAFVKGHNRRKPRIPALCQCGCGQQTEFGRGGRPNRYLYGHQARGKNNSRYRADVSEETRKKLSKGVKKAHQEGKCSWEGRKHSEKSRKRMSEAQKRTQAVNPHTPRQGAVYTCAWCGEPYYRPRCRTQTNYCSLSCSGKGNCTGEKNPFFGKTHTDATKEKLREATAKQRSQTMVLPTIPEKMVHQELDRLGVRYLTEQAIGRFCVDVLVPDKRLIIFVDGCYWHACPKHFPQAKKPKTDAARIPYLTKCGYRVGVLWEHEIQENVHGCLTRLLE